MNMNRSKRWRPGRKLPTHRAIDHLQYLAREHNPPAAILCELGRNESATDGCISYWKLGMRAIWLTRIDGQWAARWKWDAAVTANSWLILPFTSTQLQDTTGRPLLLDMHAHLPTHGRQAAQGIHGQ